MSAELKRCACSRLVEPSDWAEPYGCCDDCYWALPCDGEALSAYQRELDRERLLPDFTD